MINFEFPSVFAIDERWKGNIIRQLIRPGYSSDIAVKSYSNKRLKGYVITSQNGQDGTVLAVTGVARAPVEFDRVLRVEKGCLDKAKVIYADSSKAKWVRYPGLTPAPTGLDKYKKRIEEVLDSWQDGFFYLEESIAQQIKGLRKPQAAAVHAVHAH